MSGEPVVSSDQSFSAEVSAQARQDDEIIEALKLVAESHPRWGFGKLYQYLRNQGHGWNHKRFIVCIVP